MKKAYYNENNRYVAQQLRNLIANGDIAAGDVDERDIRDVRPDDLRGYIQCHFFAGIGGWSLALRLAGWPDDRPVWTGSCPCQPFSAAGAGLGFADERHLWPFWHWLIAQRRPAKIFGEQVASKDVEPWIDLVFTDLEATGYACGTNPFPSASVGAPHIRDRAYFVADADYARSQGRLGVHECTPERSARASGVASVVAHDHGRATPSSNRFHDVEHNAQSCSGSSLMAHTDVGACRQGNPIDGGRHPRGDAITRARPRGYVMSRELANAELSPGCTEHECEPGRRAESPTHIAKPRSVSEEHVAGPTNGFWRVADWLLCRDEKWRPVEPGTFPLVDGLPAGMGKLSTGLRRLVEVAGLDAASLKRAKAYRVGSLRGYGNAINPHQAAEFIKAAEEA
jgi:DNA (cytosine-5)-methyltransferase 1